MQKAFNTTITAALLTGLLLAQSTRTAEVDLKAAQHKAEVEGDLQGAIKQYSAIVATYRKDRAISALALVRMAECHQKLGDAEARKIYKPVVREYGDQKEAAALARVHLGGAQQPGRQSNTLVWSRPRLNYWPIVSHDGRLISFIDLDTGDVGLHEIATGTDRYLTHNPKGSGDRGLRAVVSRDGRLTGYEWWNNKDKVYEIRLANMIGDPNPRRLYANPDLDWITLQDWSPDGKCVAVQLQHKDKTTQMGLLSIPDGTLRVLKSIDWRGVNSLWFSPDGKYLGYDLHQNDAGSERDVFVLAVDGSRDSRVVAHPSNDLMMGWSPDGKWLLFASDRTGSLGLWGLPFADGKAQRAPELLRADIAGQAQPFGVTQGGILYYGVAHPEGGRYKIQIASFDFASGKFLSAPTDLTEYSESNVLPDWSPDGRSLAYTSIRGPAQRPTHRAVVIRSIDTGQVRELRPKLGYFGTTIWAPNGRSFLTLGADLKGRDGIYQIDGETGDVTTLRMENSAGIDLNASGERLGYPIWSRDGKSFFVKLDYLSTGDSAYIQKDLATGKETELIRRRFLAQVNMSPDGRYFLTTSADHSTDSRALLLIPVGGGEVRELLRWPSEVPAEDVANSTKGVWILGGTWAPDSRSFIASKIRGSMQGLFLKNVLETWRMPIDGSERQKLDDKTMRYADTALVHPAFVVHPDGKHVAIMARETGAERDREIWALENFLPKSSK